MFKSQVGIKPTTDEHAKSMHKKKLTVQKFRHRKVKYLHTHIAIKLEEC